MTAAAAVVRPAAARAATSRHIPSLDGLRALSFMLVFVAHAGLDQVVPGGFGVTVFFFLSGFLITTLLRAEYDRNREINLRHFWLRRILRIFPPFYLVLGLAVAYGLLANPNAPLSPAALAAQLLHVTNFWVIYHGYAGLPAEAGTGVYWSLAVEEHFYLLFPWLYIWMRRSGLSGARQAQVLLAICLLVLAWRCALVTWLDASTNRTYMGSDTRMDSILFGCILAVWFNPVIDRYELKPSTSMALLAMGVGGIAASLLLRGPFFRETFRYTLQGLSLAPVFIASVRFPRWPPFRLLNLRPVVFLGELSYSLYLLHYGVIFFMRDQFPALGALPRAVLALAIVLCMSWAIYHVVELPCARLRKRLTD